ncbi:MAG: YihY/virulence factor BrkB family protein [Niabella sp.]
MNPFSNIKTKLRNSLWWRTLLSWTKTTSLPGFSKISLYDVFQQAKKEIKDDDILERASAISYNFTMAIPPAIIFLFTLIPYLPISHRFITELYQLIRDVVPGPKNYTAIINFLDDFINNPRNDLLSVGFLLSLFFSSNAIIGVMRSFDKALPGFTKREGIKKRLVAIKITLILFLSFFLCIILLIARGVVLKWLGIENETIINLIGSLRWIVIVMLFFFIISYMYRVIPSIDKKWKIITPGSIIATTLMLICALSFSWWVGNFGNYNKLYGSIGTLIILMVLVFLISLSLLIGFEVNVSIHTLSKERNENEKLLQESTL